MRVLRKEALIDPGRQSCRHYEGITSEEAYGGHLIGRCRYCPRVVDYTLAQATPIEVRDMLRQKSRRGQARATASRSKEAESVISGN